MTTSSIYELSLRLQATEDGPLRGGESYQFGFYDAGVLREILNEYGGEYRVETLPIPQNAEEFEIAQQLLNDPNLHYSMVDNNKIVYARAFSSVQREEAG